LELGGEKTGTFLLGSVTPPRKKKTQPTNTPHPKLNSYEEAAKTLLLALESTISACEDGLATIAMPFEYQLKTNISKKPGTRTSKGEKRESEGH